MQSPQLLVGLLIFTGAASCFAQPVPGKRLPVPDQAEQSKAKELLRDIYKDDFAKATLTAQKLALASRFLVDAIATKDAPTERYVLLKITSDLAAAVGSADVSTRALDEIARDYEVDGDLLRLEVVEKLAASALDAELVKTGNISLSLSEKLSAADRYAEAARASAAGLQAAKRAKNLSLLKTATARNEEAVQLAQEYAATQAAAATLRTSPTDKNANLIVGKFYCFAKQDWERGLPMLALGSDEELAKLGKAELVASSPTERVACADQWLDRSEQAAGITRTALRRRAYEVYFANVKSLSGVTAKKVESRLAKLAAEFPGQPPKAPVQTAKMPMQPPKVDVVAVPVDPQDASPATFAPLNASADVHAIDLTEDQQNLVLAHKDANLVSIWDIATNKEIASFETPEPAFVMCRGSRIYVANYGPGLVSVFDGAPNWTKIAEIKTGTEKVAYLTAPGGNAFKGQMLALGDLEPEKKQVVFVDASAKRARLLGGPMAMTITTVDYDGKNYIWQGGRGSPSRSIDGFKSWPMLVAGRESAAGSRRYESLPFIRQVQTGTYWFGGSSICKGMPPVPVGEGRGQFVIGDRSKQLGYVITPDTLEAVELKGNLPSAGIKAIKFPSNYSRFDGKTIVDSHFTGTFDFQNVAVTGQDGRLRIYIFDGMQQMVYHLTTSAFANSIK